MARIHFLNVDEGDCSIIQHENGDITMIDICCGNLQTGEIEKAFSLESAKDGVKGNFNQKAHPTCPIEYLKKLGIKSIFRYIQTHPDMDHMDGLNRLADNFSVCNFWDTDNSKPSPFDANGKFGRYKKEDWDRYLMFRKSESDPKALFYYDGSSTKYFAEDDNGIKKDDYLKILSPTHELIKAANENKDWNDSSYVILYSIHGFKILFCGDADTDTLFHLTTNHADDIKNLDVLIAPHHGRDSDKDFDFLDVMKPRLSLLGNAKSKFMAYREWNNRKLDHIMNNQAGDILIDFSEGSFLVSVSNKTFADNYCQKHWNSTASANSSLAGYWNIVKYNK